jgi:hypothetical protein
MTISSTTRSATYVGNNVTTAFSTVFLFSLPTDIQVYKKLTAASTWNLLAYGTDYTVTGGGVPSAVGTVTMLVAPLSTESLQIVRTVPLTQLTNLTANDVFPAETLEASFDKLTEAAQQLDARLGVVETTVGSSFIPSEPFIFTNNAILCLKNTITTNASIPSGYNGLAIFPTISNGVTVTIAAGSVFVTLDNSLGGGNPVGGGPFATLTTNTFSGRQDFGTAGANYVARVDPAYGDFYVLKNAASALPVNTFTSEFNAFAGDLREQSGSDSIVPLHGTATSKTTHTGVTCGASLVAINDTDKTGAGLGAPLFGAIAIVQNQMYTHTVSSMAGLYVLFRNRPIASANPTNGTPGGGQGYGKNASAIYIDSQPRGSTTGIGCGWQTGIMFDKQSLDQIQGGGTLGVGIDFTAFRFSSLGPEGTPYANRIKACISFPTGFDSLSHSLPACTWDDAQTISTLYSYVGTWETRTSGFMRFAVGMGTGVLYANATNANDYSYQFDMTGQTQYLMQFSGAGGKTGVSSPSNPSTIQGWVKIRINTTGGWADAYWPLYF